MTIGGLNVEALNAGMRRLFAQRDKDRASGEKLREMVAEAGMAERAWRAQLESRLQALEAAGHALPLPGGGATDPSAAPALVGGDEAQSADPRRAAFHRSIALDLALDWHGEEFREAAIEFAAYLDAGGDEHCLRRALSLSVTHPDRSRSAAAAIKGARGLMAFVRDGRFS